MANLWKHSACPVILSVAHHLRTLHKLPNWNLPTSLIELWEYQIFMKFFFSCSRAVSAYGWTEQVEALIQCERAKINLLAAWVSLTKMRIIILIGHRSVLLRSQLRDCSNLTFKRLEEADVRSAVSQEICWHVSVISSPPLGVHAACRLHNSDSTITHNVYIT
jgi:hypothetical protein